ncbi:hypothetical protein [Halorubrum sp. Ea1]|uniref:hypothetical protein n=1 Tax=Halorubrum sp. Ea1 TaxID=1480718 RepID=UPI0011401226|nr:hypothetical protein [Halorubrum sp. Ea1]
MMTPENSSKSSPPHVDPKLSKLRERRELSSTEVSVLLRGTDERSETIHYLEEIGANDIEAVAFESIRADVTVETLETAFDNGAIEAAELARPVRVFDEGN